MTARGVLLILGFIILISGGTSETGKKTRSFEIDYENNVFLKDGDPFRYVAGSIHYFRVHPDDWEDRLYKLRYAGFNAVQTYVEWSSHQPEHGSSDFTKGLNLTRFINLAQQMDLLVILRPGPYICAERDMGGLPYWLLQLKPAMKLRSSDSDFLMYTDIWMEREFLPVVEPLLYGNGGPVIMIQVENEYGSFGACDYAYTGHLRDVIKAQVGDKALLFTTDGSGTGYLKCGKIPDVYATVDFGPGGDPMQSFAAQRLFEPRGPLVNSEYYPGWLDHWGDPHQTRDGNSVAQSLDKILAVNASVNMYMFLGGTNFGLKAGANLGSSYGPQPTSYDYDAPLTEAGDTTTKYSAIRDVVKKYLPLPTGEPPVNLPKSAYGKVPLSPMGSLLDVSRVLEEHTSQYPETFEAMGLGYGLVIYETVVDFSVSHPCKLVLDQIHDRGYVYLDNQLVGVVSRENQMYDINVLNARVNSTITIVVESQGRVNYGNNINDFKGLTKNVTFGGKVLMNWRATLVPIGDFSNIASRLEMLTHAKGNVKGGDPMTIYSGTFTISEQVNDTFLNMEGWAKGMVWVNDISMGRYWPDEGPQVTLYITRGVLQQGENKVLVLEQEEAPCGGGRDCSIHFQSTPIIDGPTPEVKG